MAGSRIPSVFKTMNDDTLEKSHTPMTVQRYLLIVSGAWGVKTGMVEFRLDY